MIHKKGEKNVKKTKQNRFKNCIEKYDIYSLEFSDKILIINGKKMRELLTR